jgi:phytoene synthase
MPPRWSDAALADFDACAELIRHGSHSFHQAGRFLPARLRRPAHAIYAFCRIADDAVDETEDCRAAAVARLRARLDRAYAGRPLDLPADRAFARTVEAFDLPRTLPEALIEGLAWDAEGRRYPTLSALTDYAARVAGAVGGMMAVLLGERSEAMLARACDLGVAMQLTNIARDVGEDARRGRIYLPLDWVADAGIDPDAFVADPRPSPALTSVLRRMLAHAERLYERSEAGIGRLPADCRPAIFAARFLYAEIGAQVARNGYDCISRRAVVSKARKRLILMRAIGAAAAPLPRAWALPKPALAETRYLVDAAMTCAGTGPPRRSLSERAERVIGILAELEARERMDRSVPPT